MDQPSLVQNAVILAQSEQAPRLKKPKIPPPPVRRLRAYSLDPSLNWSRKTATITQITIQVPWEELKPGPVGEYLEVIDVDPESGVFYTPVDLEDRYLLAQDGLPLSEGNPQFHQQMVYAVAMNTISKFERALGRKVLWRQSTTPTDSAPDKGYVQRLRLFPHAFRDVNAYYDPEKVALLFGYFQAKPEDPTEVLVGGFTFSCLSYDVAAHEMAHAILDGMISMEEWSDSYEVLAFHEGFSDLTSLLQRSTFKEVVQHEVGRTRGDLERKNILGSVATGFGVAAGMKGALRDAIGEINEATGEWKRKIPDPSLIGKVFEPHHRGEILVSAMFDAFLDIYKSRSADLIRLATGGTGVLPEGDLHPDLVARMSSEVIKSANQVLDMSIRAIDYCPPGDITFGEYLRAIITADIDMVPDDRYGYRSSLIESFRRWNIYPRNVFSLSEESLVWRTPEDEAGEEILELLGGRDFLVELTFDWMLDRDRERIANESRLSREAISKKICGQDPVVAAKTMSQLYLNYQLDAPLSIRRGPDGRPNFQVRLVRPAQRIRPDGKFITDMVLMITQERSGYFNPDLQSRVDINNIDPPASDFIIRGGCTILIDLSSLCVRYVIGKRVDSVSRLTELRLAYQRKE